MDWAETFFFPQDEKTRCEDIDSPVKKDSLFIRYFHFFGKRMIVMYAYFHLIFYKYLISFIGHIAGKFLVQYQIIPYHVCKPNELKEDPGVTEMRAMLRGEDCFDYNLDQSQLRTSLPADINPYEEIYLVSFHYKAIGIITYLLDSLKDHDEPLTQSVNWLFTWFDKIMISYLKSEVVVNKRD